MLSEGLSLKARSVLVGVLILFAYGVLISILTESSVVIMIADVISGFAVIGIAVLMYPIFKSSSKAGSLTYFLLKMAEGSLMIAGGILVLMPSTRHLRDPLYDGIHLYIFILSAFIFYSLLIATKAIPKFISIWGIAGISVLALSTILGLMNIELAFLQYFLVLIITNEVFLAIWLVFRGLKVNAQTP